MRDTGKRATQASKELKLTQRSQYPPQPSGKSRTHTAVVSNVPKEPETYIKS